MTKKKTRNSNLELLRIISMFFSVAHHCCVHGFSGIVWEDSFKKCVVN